MLTKKIISRVKHARFGFSETPGILKKNYSFLENIMLFDKQNIPILTG